MADLKDKMLKAYRYYLRVERNLSENTTSSYCSDVSAFFSGFEGDPLRAGSFDIGNYLASRSGSISKRSQSRLLSSLRSFFDYLVLEGERSDNPCDAVEYPKLGKYLPEVLSVDEVTAIIEGVDTRSWNGVRDRAILEILYGCGLRVSEVCSLKISFPTSTRRKASCASLEKGTRSAWCPWEGRPWRPIEIGAPCVRKPSTLSTMTMCS